MLPNFTNNSVYFFDPSLIQAQFIEQMEGIIFAGTSCILLQYSPFVRFVLNTFGARPFFLVNITCVPYLGCRVILDGKSESEINCHWEPYLNWGGECDNWMTIFGLFSSIPPNLVLKKTIVKIIISNTACKHSSFLFAD